MKQIYPLAFALGIALISCKDKEEPKPVDNSQAEKTEVLKTYADIAYANYSDALSDAKALETAIDNFIANPSEALLDKAKEAWLQSRESYGQTEAFRFANGPIDDADGPEGLLNAWPLDENYIDYVEGDATSGIINDTANYPNLTIEVLEGLNESGGDKNVSVGYHAVEFLLWGQDLTAPSEKKAGLRTFTDYTTATNADRRGTYLQLCAEYLVDLLSDLEAEWEADKSSNYRATLLASDKDKALADILQSIGILAQSELGGERVLAAYNAQDQEEEHSCFSDNTHRDVVADVIGVKNVFTGTYKKNDGSTITGKSLADLLKAKDETTYDKVMEDLNEALAAAEAIPAPFDLAISDAGQRPLVLESYNTLQDLGDSFVLAGQKLGLTISTELPE